MEQFGVWPVTLSAQQKFIICLQYVFEQLTDLGWALQMYRASLHCFSCDGLGLCVKQSWNCHSFHLNVWDLGRNRRNSWKHRAFFLPESMSSDTVCEPFQGWEDGVQAREQYAAQGLGHGEGIFYSIFRSFCYRTCLCSVSLPLLSQS